MCLLVCVHLWKVFRSFHDLHKFCQLKIGIIYVCVCVSVGMFVLYIWYYLLKLPIKAGVLGNLSIKHGAQQD